MRIHRNCSAKFLTMLLLAIWSIPAVGQSKGVFPITAGLVGPRMTSGQIRQYRTAILLLKESNTRRVDNQPKAEVALTVLRSAGESRTTNITLNGEIVSQVYASGFVGSPVGFRFRQIRFFDPNGDLTGFSLTRLNAVGNGLSLHYSPTGILTGYTITDWMGRTVDFDSRRRQIKESFDLFTLEQLRSEHPEVPHRDGIDSVANPLTSSIQATTIDLGERTRWVGVSLTNVSPITEPDSLHLNRRSVRTGSTVSSLPIDLGNVNTFRSLHQNDSLKNIAFSKVRVDSANARKSFTYLNAGQLQAMTFTDPGGYSFRYDRAGKLTGTSN